MITTLRPRLQNKPIAHSYKPFERKPTLLSVEKRISNTKIALMGAGVSKHETEWLHLQAKMKAHRSEVINNL